MSEITTVTVDELEPITQLDGNELLFVQKNDTEKKVTTENYKDYLYNTFPDASSENKGLFTPTDKSTLDTVAANANPYSTGTCDTAAATEAKEVTIENFSLINGATIGITFTNGNTYGDCTLTTPTYPTLSVNEGTAYPICDSRGHTAGKGFCNAGDYIELRFTGDRFVIINSDIRQQDLTDSVIYSDGKIIYVPIMNLITLPYTPPCNGTLAVSVGVPTSSTSYCYIKSDNITSGDASAGGSTYSFMAKIRKNKQIIESAKLNANPKYFFIKENNL